MSTVYQCLRCFASPLHDLDRPFEGERSVGVPVFYGCSGCGRQYVLREGGALALCWPHPLVMLLRDVALFAEDGGLRQVAGKLQEGYYGAAPGVVAEVELELKAPSHDLGLIGEGDGNDAQCRATLTSIIALARAGQEALP